MILAPMGAGVKRLPKNPEWDDLRPDYITRVVGPFLFSGCGMQIRHFQESDFEEVCRLLVDCDVEPPVEPGDLAGPCLVAVEGGEVIGVLFALAGQSTRAYLDYMAVKEGYRRRFVYYRLLTAMDAILKPMGVKRYMFHVEKWNHAAYAQLYRHRERLGVKKLNDLHYFSREIS